MSEGKSFERRLLNVLAWVLIAVAGTRVLWRLAKCGLSTWPTLRPGLFADERLNAFFSAPVLRMDLLFLAFTAALLVAGVGVLWRRSWALSLVRVLVILKMGLILLGWPFGFLLPLRLGAARAAYEVAATLPQNVFELAAAAVVLWLLYQREIVGQFPTKARPLSDVSAGARPHHSASLE